MNDIKAGCTLRTNKVNRVVVYLANIFYKISFLWWGKKAAMSHHPMSQYMPRVCSIYWRLSVEFSDNSNTFAVYTATLSLLILFVKTLLWKARLNINISCIHVVYTTLCDIIKSQGEKKTNFIIVFNEFNFVILVWKRKVFSFDFKIGIWVIFIVLMNFMNRTKSER